MVLGGISVPVPTIHNNSRQESMVKSVDLPYLVPRGSVRLHPLTRTNPHTVEANMLSQPPQQQQDIFESQPINELVQLMLPVIRHDYQIFENYEYLPKLFNETDEMQQLVYSLYNISPCTYILPNHANGILGSLPTVPVYYSGPICTLCGTSDALVKNPENMLKWDLFTTYLQEPQQHIQMKPNNMPPTDHFYLTNNKVATTIMLHHVHQWVFDYSEYNKNCNTTTTKTNSITSNISLLYIKIPPIIAGNDDDNSSGSGATTCATVDSFDFE